MKQHYRTGDQALIMEINLSIVFNHLWIDAPLSRAQLANVTGLNKTTVSSSTMLNYPFLTRIDRINRIETTISP